MSMFERVENIAIHGGTYTAVLNTGGNLSASNDIVSLLLSHSAPAGLLDARERFDAPKCDEGTRTSMIRGMKKFVQNGGTASSPAIYWLHGPAGVGKSALCQSLSLLLKSEDDHAASFFFSRTSPGRSNGNQLIATLAYQLAVNFPALQPFMLKVVKENPAILAAANAVQMQSLITDPINQWRKKYAGGARRWTQKILNRKKKLYPRLILVDGLDECDGPDVQRDLIICIAVAVRQLSLPFRFVIASRPEAHILATFELDQAIQSLDGVRITKTNLGDDEDADEQITTFLLKEFAEIRRVHPIRELLPDSWPLPSQIAQLVAKSSKGFIYPATVVRYIKMPNFRPDECLERILGLSEIPIEDKPYEPLDVLYRHIFESVPNINKAAIREIFHFLVVPNDIYDLNKPWLIEKHFNYKPGHVRHVLRDLLCLVTCTDDHSPIKVLHASLSDFLVDQSRSGRLCINIADAHATIAAIFPFFLDDTDSSSLPNTYHVGFLKHIMQANLSNTLVYTRLIGVDFQSRYIANCEAWFSHTQESHLLVRGLNYLEGAAFVTAYLLVLVIKDVQQVDIRTHIAQLKTFLLQKYPLAAILHAVRNELVPAMVPLLREWLLLADNHQYIEYIFAYEVPPSHCEIRQDIFELLLLMMTPSFGPTPGDEKYSQNSIRLQPCAQQLTVYSNHISHSLLQFIVRDVRRAAPSFELILVMKVLAAYLLRVSLAHAGYSASVSTDLSNLLTTGQDLKESMGSYLPELAPSVTDYLKRVYPEAPADSRQEILELNNAWTQYLNLET